MRAVLWHIEVSHYSEKARRALVCKGVRHERRVPMPGLHAFAALTLTRGRNRRLPILELDGQRLADSSEIVAALEAQPGGAWVAEMYARHRGTSAELPVSR